MEKASKVVIIVLIWVFGALGFAALIITMYSLSTSGSLSWGGDINLENADHIGSLVGGFVGVFWSVMGVLLLIRTLHVQKDEFKETQTAILNQQFESGYFQMLSQLQLIRESIKGFDKTPVEEDAYKHVFSGAQYLNYTYSQLRQKYAELVLRHKSNNVDYEEIEKLGNSPQNEFGASKFLDYQAFVREVYDEFYREFHPFLGHYFRYVHNIIKYVIASRMKYLDGSEDWKLSDADRYLELLQAQLSNDELVLLLYYSLSSYSYGSKETPELFNWMENVDFFRNIEESSLLRRGHHHFFPKTKFRFLSIDERKIKGSHQD